MDWDLAGGTNRDITPPPKVLSPCEAGSLLVFQCTGLLTGSIGGPCAPMSAWVVPIIAGWYRGRPTHSPTPLASFSLCKLPSPALLQTTSWPSRPIFGHGLAICLGTSSLVLVGTRSGHCTT